MLAIGRADAQPELILLDEPRSAPPKLAEDIFGIIARINAEQKVSMLLVRTERHRGPGGGAHRLHHGKTARSSGDGPAERLASDLDARVLPRHGWSTGDEELPRHQALQAAAKRWLS